MNLSSQIEAILFFKNESVSISYLEEMLGVKRADIETSLLDLANVLSGRGLVIITTGEDVALGTNPQLSSLIEKMQKEELSRDIGRAGLETLSIILYKYPVSRREIDYIRGVNSGFILRNLLIRGLIARSNKEGERSYVYVPTIELFKYLGIKNQEELPDYTTVIPKLENFMKDEHAGDE